MKHLFCALGTRHMHRMWVGKILEFALWLTWHHKNYWGPYIKPHKTTRQQRKHSHWVGSLSIKRLFRVFAPLKSGIRPKFHLQLYIAHFFSSTFGLSTNRWTRRVRSAKWFWISSILNRSFLSWACKCAELVVLLILLLYLIFFSFYINLSRRRRRRRLLEVLQLAKTHNH